MGIKWNPVEQDNLKVNFFCKKVDSALLCGAESWTLEIKMSHALDGNCKKMQILVFGVS